MAMVPLLPSLMPLLPMDRLSRILLVLGILLYGIQAQDLLDGDSGNATPLWGLSSEIHGGESPLCNKTFADANATGIFYMNPNVAQGPQTGQQQNYAGLTLDSGAAVTLYNPGFSNSSDNATAGYSLWYNTNGANYSDDYSLGYDVCALSGYSFNYNTQLRGQNDNGTCLSALDQPCISAIEAAIEQYAKWLTTPSPGPNSNLTNTSLPGVCRTLSSYLVDNMPAECSYFFQEKLDGLAWPLTSYGNSFQTGLYSSCTINDTWVNALTFFNNASESIYTAWAHSVTPLIFVWMPVADFAAQTVITQTVAKVFCGHTQNFTEGSYEPPAAPSPTPVAYNITTTNSTNNTTSSTTTTTLASSQPSNTNLSSGAIAGTAVGVVAGVGLLAALLFFLWRLRRVQKAPATEEQQAVAEKSGEEGRHELTAENAKAQLPATEQEGGRDNRAMLDSTQILEMGEGRKVHGELEAKSINVEPVELPTDQR